MSAKAVNAPVGGWNVRDGWDDMPAEDAITLDNWFPTTSGVEIRGGHISHVTGFPDYVETLAEYISPSVRQLIAASGTKLYNATSSADEIGTGFTNARWQTAMQAGNMVLVNGEDTPQVWNGSTLAAASITGPTPANLIGVTSYNSRLWYFEDDSQSVWYTAIDGHQGALTELDLGAVTTLGGKLVAVGTWTRDAGDGLNDLIVFIFQSGDMVLYTGDPATAGFSWLGKFHIGEPLSSRCLVTYGADMVIMTRDGYINLLSVLQAGESAYSTALSDKIRGAVTEATIGFGARFGWEPIFYARGHRILFNVPTGTNTYNQHVVNTITGSWCRFTGMNAQCWGTYDDNLYFGGNTEIFKVDTVNHDDGGNIVADGITAYNYLGSRGNQKQITMVRPVVKAAGFPADGIEIATDFTTPSIPNDASLVGTVTTPWGSPWGSPWGASLSIQDDWCGVGDIGYAVAMRFKMSTDKAATWYGSNYMFKNAGVI